MIVRPARAIAFLVAAVVIAAASPVALACPYCAGRNDGNDKIVLLGGMIVLPFAIAIFVVPAIRRAIREASHSDPGANP